MANAETNALYIIFIRTSRLFIRIDLAFRSIASFYIMNNTPENYVLALGTVAGDEPFANEACIELGLNRLHGQYFLWSYTAFETIHCASKKIDGANKLGKKRITRYPSCS